MEKALSVPTMLSVRLSQEERRLIEEAAAKKGWKTANFLRVSALERAAQVLNLSRPTSFDFSGAAKRYAEALLAPRTVKIVDEGGVNLSAVGFIHGPFGEGAVDLPSNEQGVVTLSDVYLKDFSPAPLTPDEVDQLQEAMRLGGPEFAAELIVECRRVVSAANDPNLPPPIDPHNLNN